MLLGSTDRIILDDDSLAELEAHITSLAPATIYSRILAGLAAASGGRKTNRPSGKPPLVGAARGR